MLLRLLSPYKNHWVEKVPVNEDSLWEVTLVEVEEGEGDLMEVEEEVKVVAVSWSCLWRTDRTQFDPADY